MPDTIRVVDDFYLMVPDKPGEGARVLNVLRDAGVNLLAFSCFPGRDAMHLPDLVVAGDRSPAPTVTYWPGVKWNLMLGSSQRRKRSSVQSRRRTILAVGKLAATLELCRPEELLDGIFLRRFTHCAASGAL